MILFDNYKPIKEKVDSDNSSFLYLLSDGNNEKLLDINDSRAFVTDHKEKTTDWDEITAVLEELEQYCLIHLNTQDKIDLINDFQE